MNQEIIWEDRDYPALYNTADSSSVLYQRIFVILFGGNLILLILCTIINYLNIWLSELRDILSIVNILFYIVVLISTLTIKLFSLERTWYNGRAVAESVKSLTWKYIMICEPYLNSSEKEPSITFLNDLRTILREIKDKNVLDVSKFSDDKQISDKMNYIRASSLHTRKDIFIKYRIDQQRKWYVKKSIFNKKWSWVLNIAIFVLQIIAIIFSIILVTRNINVNNIIPSVTAALLAWLQMRKHDELSQSYSVATQDLGLTKDKLSTVKDENGFSQYVSDTETAISREHTLWLARRDIIDYQKLK